MKSELKRGRQDLDGLGSENLYEKNKFFYYYILKILYPFRLFSSS